MARATNKPTRVPADPATARLLATVDSEARPYNDPDARYPRAEGYRQAITEGVARRAPAA